MIKTVCHNCGKEFLCHNWRLEKREHVFCSKKCQGEYKAKNNPNYTTCPVCGKRFYAKPSDVKKNKIGMACSIKCCAELRKIAYKGKGNHQYGLKGRKNASWKTDEKISVYGYRLIRKLDHPFKNIDDMVFEHRLVAEEHLLTEENSVEIHGKRYLSPDYVVHHIDGNKLNNSPDNLKVMTRSEHTSMHVRER